jgi:pyruvate dehydrogenase E1 component
VAPEAIEAVGMIAEDRRDIGLLAVTSSDRLQAGWHAAQSARDAGQAEATCHVERLLAPLARHCGLVTVVDAHPSTLSWLGSVAGHRTRALGVTRFGQTGTIADLYRLYGIDARGIAMAAQAIAPGRPIHRLRSVA